MSAGVSDPDLEAAVRWLARTCAQAGHSANDLSMSLGGGRGVALAGWIWLELRTGAGLGAESQHWGWWRDCKGRADRHALSPALLWRPARLDGDAAWRLTVATAKGTQRHYGEAARAWLHGALAAPRRA